MTAPIFKQSLIGAVILVSLAFGAWYFMAPPDAEQAQLPGRIEGTTMFPSEVIPAFQICAESTTTQGVEYCVDTLEYASDLRFSIPVPAGTYYVYATLRDAGSIGSDLGGYKAYYTQAVVCGLAYGCTDHTKLEVVVGSEETVTGVLPHDWYIR